MTTLNHLKVLFVLGTICLQFAVLNGCSIDQWLRDKWHFHGMNSSTFLRIREKVLVAHNTEIGKIRYKCIEKQGNIYLLRKKVFRPKKDGILCVGFTYFKNQLNGMNSIVRLNSDQMGRHLLSPQLVKRDESISIQNNCNLLHTNKSKPNAFLVRAPPGCRIPNELRGEWRYTLMQALNLIVDVKFMTLVLLDGSRVKLTCESRDGQMFLFRVKQYSPGRYDAYICLKIRKLPDDPHYAFELSRLNSGNALGNQVRLIGVNQHIHLHSSCDWIESPGIAEYLYS